MSDTQPDGTKAFEQKRIAKRQRVLKSAKIVLDDWRAIDCVLRDVSDTGAKIRVHNTLELKQTFRLYTAMDNMIRDVKLAWKHHDEIGVVFTSEAKICALRKF
jgi:hypothetical protein